MIAHEGDVDMVTSELQGFAEPVSEPFDLLAVCAIITSERTWLRGHENKQTRDVARFPVASDARCEGLGESRRAAEGVDFDDLRCPGPLADALNRGTGLVKGGDRHRRETQGVERKQHDRAATLLHERACRLVERRRAASHAHCHDTLPARRFSEPAGQFVAQRLRML